MNEFEKALLHYFDRSALEAIQSVKIGIAGAGGLGSNCAANLVRTGFKYFTIVDFDCVEYSNLNRQFFFIDQVGIPKVAALEENLKRINPDIAVTGRQLKIESDNVAAVFAECDVVIEAFDKAEYKKMIIETYAQSGKLLISASGIAGYGETDAIIIKRIHEMFLLVGDGKSGVSAKKPPLSPGVTIAAAKEADCVLDYILGNR